MTEHEPGDGADPDERVPYSNLEQRMRRTLERRRRLPPGHRRDLPDPDNPRRPELEVLSIMRSMRAATEQAERDHSPEP
jgi:hypothetical protein